MMMSVGLFCVLILSLLCYYQDLYVKDDISLRRGVCYTGYEYIDSASLKSSVFILCEQRALF